MKIAMIPWDDSIRNNSIFYEKYKGYVDPHILLKKAFEDVHMELNTVDVYQDLGEVDCFLFFTLNYTWLRRVIKKGLLNKAIYCSGEPAVVKPENSKEGYRKLLKIFPFIMTWNEKLVDNERIFIRNIPYHFVKHYGKVPFPERKLLTNISGNKRSKQPFELYSEREKVISFFEQNHPDEFDLYGVGWNAKEHPSYKGIAESKIDVYHKYKFALSLENTYNVHGYVTEKMPDCFVTGIVPIYKGASNIDDYVPRNCYINYDDFDSLEDLAVFLERMTEEEYNKYLNAIDQFLDFGEKEKFSSEKFCKDICEVIKRIKDEKKTISFYLRLKIAILELKEKYDILSMRMRKEMKQLLLGCINRKK